MLEALARPLRGLWDWIANLMGGFYRLLGAPGRWLQWFLNGTWLGHSLHAVVVDVAIGAATSALFLDLLRVVLGVDGLADATVYVVLLAWLAGVASVVSGLTDYKDTAAGDERNVAGLHGVTNIVAVALLAASTIQRLLGNDDAGFWLLLVGYLVLSVGGYIGGHVVFKHGYAVNRNAFARGKRAKEYTAVLPAAELPEGAPTKASLGATALVLVRRGDVVAALKETCSHAGGPLSEGELDGDVIVCPWHGSRFRLSDGAVRGGPATSRQVAYRARISGDQVEVQGPIEGR